MIAQPQFLAARLYHVQILDLSPEESRDQLGRQERRAGIHPAIFIDLAPEEFGTVGALLPDYLRPADEARVVDGEKTPFAGDYVLGLMELEASQMTYRTERTALVV